VKKLFAAIVLATVAIGYAGVPVSAQENPNAAEQRRLFREGAKLWPVYCNTCHNARPGSEKAPYEWDQVMMHMRTLGNIPPDDANAILVYLKSR
jgi:mono/diheme cytochrome c family protein